MTARRGEHEARRQLCKSHGCGRDRTEARTGTGAPAEGIQRIAAGQKQERDQPQTVESKPIESHYNSSWNAVNRSHPC